MSDVAITVEGLSKSYRIGASRVRHDHLREAVRDAILAPFGKRDDDARTVWALNDVSFEVKRGEVLGVIGRNGAGKSTLLKILSRITEPTKGRATIHGRVGSLLEVGTGFHPELTGRENIFLSGSILGMSRAEIMAKFDEIVAFSEIEKFIDTPVKRYSSGMYVRLAFAVAAHLEPEILLVDEVLAVGDASFQKKCMGKMGDIRGEGRTILFVSHNMSAIERLCSSCVWIDKGGISYRGHPRETIERYMSVSRKSDHEKTIFEMPRDAELGKKARIGNVAFFDSKGRMSNSFAFGEPIKILVSCEAMNDISDVSFLIGFDTLIEERIVTVTSLEAGAIFSAKRGETITGTVEIAGVYLKPGMYGITLGLFSTNLGLDRVPGVATIEIIPKSHDATVSDVSQVTVGHIQAAPQKWSIKYSIADTGHVSEELKS